MFPADDLDRRVADAHRAIDRMDAVLAEVREALTEIQSALRASERQKKGE